MDSFIIRFQGLRKAAAALFALLVSLSGVHPAAAFDFSDWDALVKKYVAAKTIDGVRLNAVNYQELKNDADFKALAQRLESAELSDLKTREDKLTFWINVYNILAAKMITDHHPVDSIKDVGSIFKSVWKRDAGVVAGEQRTLNDVEHEILRKMGEPRIHVAIVCASVSCPDLRTEAYVAERLDEQLEDQMKLFLDNKEKGLIIDEKKNRVYLSKIFDWFEEDFDSHGGVLAFVAKYVDPKTQALLKKPKLKVSYLDYNWNVNQL